MCFVQYFLMSMCWYILHYFVVQCIVQHIMHFAVFVIYAFCSICYICILQYLLDVHFAVFTGGAAVCKRHFHSAGGSALPLLV